MKKLINKPVIKIGLCLVPYILFAAILMLSSFTTNRFADDVLKQLGMNKSQAEAKITGAILNGYVDLYGVSNARNIAAGNRKAVVLDLLKYVRQHVSTDSYRQEYLKLRESNKPQFNKIQTPAELKEQTVASYKEALASAEKMVKSADPANKATFQQLVDDAKIQLKKAEDPNNKMYLNYARNYDQMMKEIGEGEKRQLEDWDAKYPANPMLYVKQRLLEFMDATADIDFNAELIPKNGHKVFANPAYESKSSRWKMAFRAGKEVVIPAREFVQQWINELSK